VTAETITSGVIRYVQLQDVHSHWQACVRKWRSNRIG